MNIRWTDGELENAIKLHDNGYTFLEIGNIMERTEKSIRLKLNKYGYKQNISITKIISKCLTCNKKINDYIINNRKFCSRSCAVITNNYKTKKKNKKK